MKGARVPTEYSCPWRAQNSTQSFGDSSCAGLPTQGPSGGGRGESGLPQLSPRPQFPALPRLVGLRSRGEARGTRVRACEQKLPALSVPS